MSDYRDDITGIPKDGEQVNLGGLQTDKRTVRFFYQNHILLVHGILMPRCVPVAQALNVIVALLAADHGIGMTYCLKQYGEEARPSVEAQYMDQAVWHQWVASGKDSA